VFRQWPSDALSAFRNLEQNNWSSYANTGDKMVPFVTTGWDPRPRIDALHSLLADGVTAQSNSSSDSGTIDLGYEPRYIRGHSVVIMGSGELRRYENREYV